MNKKLVVVLVAACLMSGLAVAKPKPQAAHEATIDDMIAKLKIQLRLSDQQVSQVKPIIEDYLAREKQLKMDEKKALSHVLSGDQLYTWNFLQNEAAHEKKKK